MSTEDRQNSERKAKPLLKGSDGTDAKKNQGRGLFSYGRKLLFVLQSISGKLYTGLILFFGFILLLSLFSWKSLLKAWDIQTAITTKTMPELILAGNIVRQSEKLIQFTPELIARAGESQPAQIQKALEEKDRELKASLEEFKQSSVSKNFPEISSLLDEMSASLKSIERLVFSQTQLKREIEKLSKEIYRLSLSLFKELTVKIDHQTFQLAMKSRAEGLPLSPSEIQTSEKLQLKDILLYKDLFNLQVQINVSARLLQEVVDLSNADRIQPLRERFISALRSSESALSALPPEYKGIKTKVLSLKEIGMGADEKNLFDLKSSFLSMERVQKQHLEKNRELAEHLSKIIGEISLSAIDRNRKSALFFEKSLVDNRNLLFIINGLSLLGCLIVAIFFINPLIRRLNFLSRKMRSMSKGNLKEPVPVQGQDELAKMASALELFRRHTLEAQRLNLVEKLATELKDKNQSLKKTVRELNETRDRMVIQEKLASLGQLTSGIAHEIKNPLNFINNFSQISKDLLKELRGESEKLKPKIPGKTWSFISSTFEDLRSNMEKIFSHGKRASDIITGMLEHSKGGEGQREVIDMNKFVENYYSLAFQSYRSSNPSFNVQFEKSYGEKPLFIEAVPQDISRLILNILTNAFDAIEEKRESLKTQSFKPCIFIELTEAQTKDQTGDQTEAQTKDQTKAQTRDQTKAQTGSVQVKIKDNGIGISASVKEKIFNPFWTNKVAGKGTGLGLSLSHDIVSKYGGSLQVESEEGEWTEFIFQLPLKS